MACKTAQPYTLFYMTKLLKLNNSKLRNEEHFQFHSEITEVVEKHDPVALDIDDEHKQHASLLPSALEALLLIRKSATTNQIIDANAKRKGVFRGMVDAVKSALNHFNEDKAAAADRVWVMVNSYGNVTAKGYIEETGAFVKFVQDATTTYAADFALLQLTDWVTELDARNRAFALLMNNRYTESSEKTSLRMKELRPQLDLAYRSLAERIDALVLIKGFVGYETLVHEINARIDKYNNLLAQRKGRHSKNDPTKQDDHPEAN